MSSENSGFHVSTGQKAGNPKVDNLDFFESLQRYVQGRELRNAFDSLPPAWKSRTTQLAIDSVVTLVNGPWERKISDVQSLTADSTNAGGLDTIPLNFVNRQVKIAVNDLVELTPEQILDRYQFQDWKDRVLITQSIKSLKDSRSLIRTYTGNFGWTVLLLIAFMSLVLYLMYIRRKRYYVEHFVFLMHQNSGAFMLLTFGLLAEYFSSASIGPLIWTLLVCWITISLLLAMKRFYKQSWPKTILKWVLYCFLYGISFTLIFAISLITVFLIF
jgi:hypothetical protein